MNLEAVEALPFCNAVMQKLLPQLCPHKAANGSANGNGGGLVPGGSDLAAWLANAETATNLEAVEALPFCNAVMQKLLPQLCPHKAANGSANGNGGGLVPGGSEELEAELATALEIPFWCLHTPAEE